MKYIIQLAYNSCSISAIAIRIIVNATCSSDTTVDNTSKNAQHGEYYHCNQ